MKLAYLVNTYPKASHSFIRREIQALERLGHCVHRFALRVDSDGLVDPADRAELSRTEPVVARGGPALAWATATTMARAPGRFAAAAALAIGCGRAAGSPLRHVAYLAEACLVSARCRALGIDHLHAHFGTNSATVAMLASALGGPSFSFTVHGPEEFDRPVALSLREKIRRAAFCVAISSYGRSQLLRWADHANWPRVRVVHCGVEPRAFDGLRPLPANGVRLVAIGRFVEQKGQLLLLEALARARETRPALTLTLVGDGEMRGLVEAAIARHGIGDAVTLTGWLDEAGVRAALDAASALVLPSFAEGLPVVVMEAMAAGRPVVASSIAGVPELVRDGETGWLAPAGDVEALADALRRLAETPSARLAELGRAGRDRVRARHDVDAQAARLADLFADCARPASDPRRGFASAARRALAGPGAKGVEA